MITIKDAMKITGISYDHARQLVHGLTRDRWLAVIQPGKYEFIPAERGEHAFPDTNPLFLGSVLVEPYYFSYATAAFFHALSTQASDIVFIATTLDLPRRKWVRQKEYHLVYQPAYKFFGWAETNAYGALVKMADPEKTILDCLDHPVNAGDIPEIAQMLWRGKSNLDWQKLVSYSFQFHSRSLLQRLGYLIDLLSISIEDVSRNILLEKAVDKTKCYLGQPGRWKTGGEYSPTWQIVDNIPRRFLVADIDVA